MHLRPPHGRPRRAAVVTLLGAGVLLALGASCSSSDQPAVSSDASGPTSAPTSSTIVPADPETTVDVLFTGDSVMQQVAAAGIDALDVTGVHATFASTIAIAGQPETVVGWQTVMAVDPPDLVVVMVGTWERDAVRAGLQQGGWPEPYLEQVTPFVETLTAAGAEVVWLTYPPSEGEEASDVAALNEALTALPARFPGVQVVDAGSTVAGPSGERVRTVVDDDGVERVVREPSVHLCPDGVVRVATPMVAAVAEQLAVTPNPGWEQGAWREDPSLFTDLATCEG